MMAISKHWLTHIERWQRSGISQAAYCRQHGLNANSFTGRLSEFRKKGNPATPKLIPIQVSKDEEPSSINKLVLTVNNGRQSENGCFLPFNIRYLVVSYSNRFMNVSDQIQCTMIK